MKIDWQARFHNPQFWFQIAISIAMPVGAYFGIKAEDVTTWHFFFQTAGRALSNPFVLMMVAGSVYNSVINPTTKGVKD